MQTNKKNILLKISGEVFSSKEKELESIIKQLKVLKTKCNIGIVIGAGNIFRGRSNGKELNLEKASADEVGMLATIVNGRMLQAILEKVEIPSVIYSAIECPKICEPLSQNKINLAMKIHLTPIFVGGTGNPYFSTDTTSVIRGLQIKANEIWKATKVDGVFDKDPKKDKNAKLIKKISYDEVIEKKLGIMDLTAITLAKQNKVKIRVFNLFEENALLKAFSEPDFGSIIE
jgi:uridylate kinase